MSCPHWLPILGGADWALKGQEPPKFRQNKVTYYVAERDEWRYATALPAIPTASKTLYLSSGPARAVDQGRAGDVTDEQVSENAPSAMVSDPSDFRVLQDDKNPTLEFESAPLMKPLTISGRVTFTAYVAIDQKDADFVVNLEEVRKDGSAITLSHDWKRARYNKSLQAAALITQGQVTEYVFTSFRWFTRELGEGSRLRLSFSTLNNLYFQRNMGTGGYISDETIKDARTVHLTLYHDSRYASRLTIPVQ
jgi:hypothetical protein